MVVAIAAIWFVVDWMRARRASVRVSTSARVRFVTLDMAPRRRREYHEEPGRYGRPMAPAEPAGVAVRARGSDLPVRHPRRRAHRARGHRLRRGTPVAPSRSPARPAPARPRSCPCSADWSGRTPGRWRSGVTTSPTSTGTRPRRYRRDVVGFVFQDFGLLGQLTALENVELALTFSRGSRGRRRARARELLAGVGLVGAARASAARPERGREAAGGDRARARQRTSTRARRRTDGKSRRGLHRSGARDADERVRRARGDRHRRHARRDGRGESRYPARTSSTAGSRLDELARRGRARAPQRRPARWAGRVDGVGGRLGRRAVVVAPHREQRRQATRARSGDRRWTALRHQGRRGRAVSCGARQRQPATRPGAPDRRRGIATDRTVAGCRVGAADHRDTDRRRPSVHPRGGCAREPRRDRPDLRLDRRASTSPTPTNCRSRSSPARFPIRPRGPRSPSPRTFSNGSASRARTRMR